MSIFLNSLKKGLESAMSSRIQQIEILNVVNELGEQVRSISYGLATVKLQKLKAPNPKAKSALDQLLDTISYTALAVVTGGEKQSVKQIAVWFQQTEGYPVKIEWGNVSYSCANREGLEQILMKIAADESFGVIIRDIIYANGKTVNTATILNKASPAKKTAPSKKVPSAKVAPRKKIPPKI